MGYFSCNRRRDATDHCLVHRRLKLRIFSHRELETATSVFSPSTFLGRGSHASVFLATFNSGRLLAAVKVPSDATAHNNEIAILSTLPRRTPFLVNLIGHTSGTALPRIAVFEFMPGGCLHDLLHYPGRPPPPRHHRLRLALHVAESLAFLHSLVPPVIHRDIKPSNILIDGTGRARLGDLGLAVRLEGINAPLPPPAGTIGYIDPAYVAAADVSMKCDVYSFGVLLLEVLSGRRAIDVKCTPHSLVDWAAVAIAAGRWEDLWGPWDGERVTVAEEDVIVLVGRCIAADAEMRPCMEEVVVALRDVDRRSTGLPGMMTWQQLAWRGKGGKPSTNTKVSDVQGPTNNE